MPRAASRPVLLEGVEGALPPAGDLADQVEIFLADALGELVDHGGEEARRARVHVLDGIDAEAVDVGIGDPELVRLAQRLQGGGGRVVVDRAVAQVDVLQVEEVAFQELGIVIPVVDAALAR